MANFGGLLVLPLGSVGALILSRHRVFPARQTRSTLMTVASSQRFGRRHAAALAVVSTCAWLTLILLPYEVTTLSGGYHLRPAVAGWIAAAELLALACAASWLGQTIAIRNKRRLTLLGVAIALAATLGCLLTDHLVLIVALRLLFGVGTGMIAAATNALPASHHNPRKLFAYMQLVLGLIFALSIYAVAAAEPIAGRRVVFFVELFVLLILGPTALLLPEGISSCSPSVTARAGHRLSQGATSSLAALGLMWVAQAAIWAFAADAGASAGIDSNSLAHWLAIAGFTAPIGAAAASGLGDRRGYAAPLILGYTAQVLVALAMYCSASRNLYIVGALINNMTTTFTTPYLMGILATLDRTGRAAALGAGAINFGCAVGPALGATLIGMPTVAPIGFMAAVVFSAGLAFALSSLRTTCRTPTLEA
jgi:predicted MFS family arabinose efflux permease